MHQQKNKATHQQKNKAMIPHAPIQQKDKAMPIIIFGSRIINTTHSHSLLDTLKKNHITQEHHGKS